MADEAIYFLCSQLYWNTGPYLLLYRKVETRLINKESILSHFIHHSLWWLPPRSRTLSSSKNKADRQSTSVERKNRVKTLLYQWVARSKECMMRWTLCRWRWGASPNHGSPGGNLANQSLHVELVPPPAPRSYSAVFAPVNYEARRNSTMGLGGRHCCSIFHALQECPSPVWRFFLRK